MRKLATFLLLLISVNCFSIGVSDDVIIVTEKNTSNSDANPKPKTPSQPIIISTIGNTVSWNELYSFEWIQILDAETDAILFNADISTEETSVVIPSYISGEVVIRLFNGNVWYRGIVTL